MIVLLLADGFEEIEALTPVDILRRAGVDVRTVAIAAREVVGAHDIRVIADMTADELDMAEVEGVIFPGGMPGSLNLDASPVTDVIIDAVNSRGGRIAAICAAPIILGCRGLLDGRRATCYPGFEDELRGAILSTAPVVTDGNITTSRGMGTALAFSLELVRLFVGADKARDISAGICSNEEIKE